MLKPSAGYTLLEVLIVSVIAAILMTQAFSGASGLIQKNKRHASVSTLVTFLNTARNTAISQSKSVTVCSVNADKQCSNSWTGDLVAFRDPHKTQAIDTSDQIIRIIPADETKGFTFNGGIRNYFRFRPTGMAREAIGNITWCPEDGDPTLAAQLRINMGGRIQLARDSDQDGVVEDAAGRPVSCS